MLDKIKQISDSENRVFRCERSLTGRTSLERSLENEEAYAGWDSGVEREQNVLQVP